MATGPTDPNATPGTSGRGSPEPGRTPRSTGDGSPRPVTPPAGGGRSAGSARPGGGAGDGTGAGGDASVAGGQPEQATPPTPFTQQLGRVTIVVLAVLFGIFAVANSQPVDFSWIFGETIARESAGGAVTGGVPLILLLIAAFAIGAAVTLLVELFVSRGRRARRTATDKGTKKGGKRDGKT